MRDSDSKLIFEAYTKSINEAPIYSAGDLDIPEPSLKAAPGGGYGLGKAATKSGKSIQDVANELVKKIQTALFKPEPHTVDGIEYTLFYPGSDMKFKNDLVGLIQKELGLGKTEAGYTARIVRNMLNIVVKDEQTGGKVARPEKIKAAVQAGAAGEPVAASVPTDAPKPAVKTETVYEIDKSVVLPDKVLKSIVISLPDEDVPEKEILGVLKAALNEYNDKPGIEPVKLKSFDLLDKLKEAGVLKEKQIEKEAPEGEGSGEVETIDDYPESDDVGSVARELGMVGRGSGFDPGGFSFND